MNYTIGEQLGRKIYKVAVKFGEVTVGYRVYRTGGLFNTLVFLRYEWK